MPPPPAPVEPRIRASAPVETSEEAAITSARARGLENIKAELAILNRFVKTDHSEQVAEIIGLVPIATHNQRGIGTLYIGCAEGSAAE